MPQFASWFLPFILSGALMTAHAQAPMQASGTLVIIPAFGEVKQPNDEAHATLMVEEHDKDKAAAASRVNQKMKQGVEILKKADPLAALKTRGYYTYPVYSDDQARPAGRARVPVSWRVGQYLELTTTNLGALPKTVAAAQQVLALSSLHFGLTDVTSRKLDEKRIEASYRNLTERIAAIAKAMGRNPADAVLETVDFEGTGAYAPQQEAYAPKAAMRAAAMDAVPVEEPSFEPGESTSSLRIVGKVRFK
jgi:uncharacterized protein YggE